MGIFNAVHVPHVLFYNIFIADRELRQAEDTLRIVQEQFAQIQQSYAASSASWRYFT